MSRTTPAPAAAPASNADPTAGLTGVPLALAQALLAEPGGGPAALALAIGTSRPTAARVLAAMETEGLVRRERGGTGEGNVRRPDRWYLNPAADDGTGSTASTTPEAGPDDAGSDTAPRDASPNAVAKTAITDEAEISGEQPQGQVAEPGTARDVTEESAVQRMVSKDLGGDDANETVTHRSETVTQDLDPTDSPAHSQPTVDSERPADNAFSDDRPGSGQPSAELLPPNSNEVLPPASSPGVAPGEPCPTCGHRTRPPAQRTASGGGARLGQGQLHELALDHLRAYPGEEFTATGIAKVIGRSSGAISNALVTMVNRGEAEMTCAAPRRYRAVTAAPEAHEAPPVAG